MNCWLLFLVLFCFSVSTVHFGNCNNIEAYSCYDISVGLSFLLSFSWICSAAQWWLCQTLEFRTMSEFCFCASPGHLFICSEMNSRSWVCQELRSVYSFGPCTFSRVALQLLWLVPSRSEAQRLFSVSYAELFRVELLRKLLEVRC